MAARDMLNGIMGSFGPDDRIGGLYSIQLVIATALVEISESICGRDTLEGLEGAVRGVQGASAESEDTASRDTSTIMSALEKDYPEWGWLWELRLYSNGSGSIRDEDNRAVERFNSLEGLDTIIRDISPGSEGSDKE